MKFTAYILLFYFCIGAMIPKGDFSQLLKLNDLLEHYDLHQKEVQALSKRMSVCEFLYLHFVVGDDHHDDDESQHDDLPFQQINSSDFQIAQYSFELSKSFVLLFQNRKNIYLSIEGEELTTSIFRPPAQV